MTIIGPGEGTTIEGPVGGPLTFKVRGEQTGGRLTALENVVLPGEGPPLHTHAREEEAFYILSGELRFRVGDEDRAAPMGSFVFIPRGTPHCFTNERDVPARVLVLFTPSGMEGFFERFAAIAEPTPASFASAGADIGMEVVGPPLGAQPGAAG
jgi:quercetin dioxygenase-like cupin family protein